MLRDRGQGRLEPMTERRHDRVLTRPRTGQDWREGEVRGPETRLPPPRVEQELTVRLSDVNDDYATGPVTAEMTMTMREVWRWWWA